MSERPRVVIVGAGFGGLRAARDLAGLPVEVVLLDRDNYHTFLPLLYQVAAAELEPEDIAYPARSILRKASNVSFAMAEAKGIDLSGRVLEADNGPMPYDFLILALGSVSHFFEIPGAREYAFPLKTLEEGVALRNHILCCFERAEREPDAEKARRLLTFAIVGGGPTGVEFAGALSELIRGPQARDYPTLDLQKVHVVLLQAVDSLLSDLPDRLGAYAEARLREMGVDVRLRAQVSEVTSEAARLEDGSVIPTETVVWTAGVRGAPLAQLCGLPTVGNGRVAVLPNLQVPGYPEVYVVGDLAFVDQGGRPLPMIAPVAIQQGAAVARNIARQLEGKGSVPFRYRDHGTMVSIGRNSGVAHLGSKDFTGFVAWLLWLTVHLYTLIGFRNRLLVLSAWAWDYLFYERAVRLILPLGGGLATEPAKCRSAGEPARANEAGSAGTDSGSK